MKQEKDIFQSLPKKIIANILKDVETKSKARVSENAQKILFAMKQIPYDIVSEIEASITSNKKYISRQHPGEDSVRWISTYAYIKQTSNRIEYIYKSEMTLPER